MKIKSIIALLCAVATTAIHSISFANEFSSSSYAKRFSARTLVNALPVTGPNRFCGQLRWSFEDQGLTPLSFRQIGAYKANSDTPDELTSQNCVSNQVLATIHDPIISTPPVSIVQAPDLRLQNVPLRDMPKTAGILQGGTTGLRTDIDRNPVAPANPFPIFASTPDADITLGQWASARGRMTYRCRGDGTANVRVSFNNLIGNGVYSMWGIWRTTLPNGVVTSLPSPFGGVPNALVPNARGRASFQRNLPFCPDQETADGSLLLWVALAYHSDATLYAGVPDAADMVTNFIDGSGNAYQSTLSLLVHHEQLAFPINFTSTLSAQ